MSSRIKPKRKADPFHLSRIRSLGCYCCRVDGDGWRPAEAHHPRANQGMGTKAPDSEAIPLCSKHHNEQHPHSLSIHRNPLEFKARYGTEAEILARVTAQLEVAS